MPLIVPLMLIGFGVALLLYGTRLWLLGAGIGALLGLGLLRLLPGEQSGVFGMLVALVSTWRGYTCERSAAGVSAATTSTVVVASVATLIFDYFITALWGV